MLFKEFEYLSQFNIDFNQIDIQNIIEIVRILSPMNSIEIFSGIILDINNNYYYKEDHNISFPTVVLIWENMQLENRDQNDNYVYYTLEEYEKLMNEKENKIKSVIESKLREDPDTKMIIFS